MGLLTAATVGFATISKAKFFWGAASGVGFGLAYIFSMRAMWDAYSWVRSNLVTGRDEAAYLWDHLSPEVKSLDWHKMANVAGDVEEFRKMIASRNMIKAMMDGVNGRCGS